MPTSVQIGTKVEEIELLDLFEASEGTIVQYYGRIGNGKTYNATADILHDLSRGEVVYANWKLNYEGFDERADFFCQLRNLILFRKRFFYFPKENLHYIDLDDEFMDKFEKLTDCKVYLDEGHVIFDSYQTTKFSMQKRKAILHTRHFNRTIAIITQRPTAIHVSARANVNIFYKCEKVLSWPFLIFRRTEYQDQTGETVDETKPISKKWYLAKKHVLEAYNSKYLRGGIPKSQKVYFQAYDLNFRERFALFLSGFVRFIFLLKQENESNPPEAAATIFEPENRPEKKEPVKTRRVDWAKVKRQREKERKEKEALKDQEVLPF